MIRYGVVGRESSCYYSLILFVVKVSFMLLLLVTLQVLLLKLLLILCYFKNSGLIDLLLSPVNFPMTRMITVTTILYQNLCKI